MSRIRHATISSFSTQHGRGALQLEDGGTLEFADWAVRVSIVEIEPGMRVAVELGPSSVPGVLRVLRLWPGEPPQWAVLGGWAAAPAEMLALLRGAGLATRVTASELQAACYKLRFDAMLKDNDIRDVQAQVQADSLDPATAIAGLATLYGLDGPNRGSLADRAFVLTAADEHDPRVRSRVVAALAGLVGGSLECGEGAIDDVLTAAADRVAARGGGEELYSLAGQVDGGPLCIVAVGRPGAFGGMLAVRRYAAISCGSTSP